MKPRVIIDLETAGLMPGRGFPVEVGVAFVAGGEIVGHAGRVLRPENLGRLHYPPYTTSTRFHHIYPSEIRKDGITEKEAVPWLGDLMSRFGEKYGDFEWGAHNAKFEKRWLCRAPWHFPDPDFCTMEMARGRGLGGKLEDMCDELGIDIGTAHRAVDDAIATAKLLLALPEPEEVTTEESFRQAAGPVGKWVNPRPKRAPVEVLAPPLSFPSRAEVAWGVKPGHKMVMLMDFITGDGDRLLQEGEMVEVMDPARMAPLDARLWNAGNKWRKQYDLAGLSPDDIEAASKLPGKPRAFHAPNNFWRVPVETSIGAVFLFYGVSCRKATREDYE